jgi:hypothetical protein
LRNVFRLGEIALHAVLKEIEDDDTSDGESTSSRALSIWVERACFGSSRNRYKLQ